MKIMYPIGYIFLLFFQSIFCTDRISQYYTLYESLEKYRQLLIEKHKDKNIQMTICCSSEQVEMSVKTTSDFATSCIMLTTLSKQPNLVAQGNIIIQAALAAYAMGASIAEIIKYKKEQRKSYKVGKLRIE